MGPNGILPKGKNKHAPFSVDARVSERAYELWMERGGVHQQAAEGPDHADWVEAEEQIREDLDYDDAQ